MDAATSRNKTMMSALPVRNALSIAAWNPRAQRPWGPLAHRMGACSRCAPSRSSPCRSARRTSAVSVSARPRSRTADI